MAFANRLEEELRWTVDGRPMSARFVPDDERPKAGWGGLFGAKDMREEEAERP